MNRPIQKSTQNYQSSGFTLVEVVIYLGLFSIIVSAMMPTLFLARDVEILAMSVGAEISDKIFIDTAIRSLFGDHFSIISPGVGSSSQNLEILTGGKNHKISIQPNGKFLVFEGPNLTRFLHGYQIQAESFRASLDNISNKVNLFEYDFSYKNIATPRRNLSTMSSGRYFIISP